MVPGGGFVPKRRQDSTLIVGCQPSRPPPAQRYQRNPTKWLRPVTLVARLPKTFSVHRCSSDSIVPWSHDGPMIFHPLQAARYGERFVQRKSRRGYQRRGMAGGARFRGPDRVGESHRSSPRLFARIRREPIRPRPQGVGGERSLLGSSGHGVASTARGRDRRAPRDV